MHAGNEERSRGELERSRGELLSLRKSLNARIAMVEVTYRSRGFHRKTTSTNLTLSSSDVVS